MARPPEQAIDEAIAALGHFELIELGAAVNELREELEAECALADRLYVASTLVVKCPSDPGAWAEWCAAQAAYRERHDG